MIQYLSSKDFKKSNRNKILVLEKFNRVIDEVRYPSLMIEYAIPGNYKTTYPREFYQFKTERERQVFVKNVLHRDLQ